MADPAADTLLNIDLQRIAALTDDLVASYRSEPRTQHIDATFLPSQAQTVELIAELRSVVFPGFFHEFRLTSDNVHEHTRANLLRVHKLLYEQTRQALRYDLNRREGGAGDNCDDCDHLAADVTDRFLERLPEVRRLLATDVQATFDGDPASDSTDETIFCYPGVYAIMVYRLAHALVELSVPILPRIMAEHAHMLTGIDIHPGATLGESFCIDHGTGIVIGETCQIGRNVKVYQGVTLGALSLKGGHERWRGRKRHPTIEDDVTIYGNAIILGGETVIGRGATIGGSVFITSSIPAGARVTMGDPQLKISTKRAARV